jgi:cytosine/adenosine deaminase-related metal-dependent hydrolase
MHCVAGKVLTPEGFIDGHVIIDEGMVKEVASGKGPKPMAEGIVIPTFINAHTHVADYSVPVDLDMSLEELVAPPDGLKHRMLRSMPEETARASMSAMSEHMMRQGISSFIDFREGGAAGSRMLRESAKAAAAIVMGRPGRMEFDRAEADAILESADGIACSSISDYDLDVLRQLSQHARSRGKMFALHASERSREDMDAILDLKPSFLVHLNHAADEDIESCAKQKVPIVICPRSNLFFGQVPPVRRMMALGADVCLGTDNAMFCLPDMLVEMECCGRLMRAQGMQRLGAVVEMATRTPRILLRGKATLGIEPGMPSDLMVLRHHGGDAVTDLVLRNGAQGPMVMFQGDRIWRW